MASPLVIGNKAHVVGLVVDCSVVRQGKAHLEQRGTWRASEIPITGGYICVMQNAQKLAD